MLGVLLWVLVVLLIDIRGGGGVVCGRMYVGGGGVGEVIEGGEGKGGERMAGGGEGERYGVS